MTEAEQERARVVAWLRENAAAAILYDGEVALRSVACAIEARDHLKGVE